MPSGLTVNFVQRICLVPSSIACVVTVIRLVDRKIHRRFWWDDLFAAVSMISLILVVAGYWARNSPQYPTSSTLRIVTYYLDGLGFTTAVWSARFSILYTLVRVAPTILYTRCLYGIAIGFGMFYLIIFIQTIWTCAADPGQWEQDTMNAQCPLGNVVAIIQIVTDVIADLVLIGASFYMLWNVRIGKARRIRLMAVFNASIGTTVVSLVHASYIMRDDPAMEALTAIVEDSVSLIVCNLAVIVAVVYRYINSKFRADENTEDLPTRPSQGTVVVGQTLHLSRLGGMTNVVRGEEYRGDSRYSGSVIEEDEIRYVDVGSKDVNDKPAEAPGEELESRTESVFPITAIIVHEHTMYEYDRVI